MSRHGHGTLAAVAGLFAAALIVGAVVYGKKRASSRPIPVSEDTLFARSVLSEARALRKKHRP